MICSQVSRSDERTVVLKNLHIDMTGLYTCEVSTEGIFETRQKSAKMTVIGKQVSFYLWNLPVEHRSCNRVLKKKVLKQVVNKSLFWPSVGVKNPSSQQ